MKRDTWVYASVVGVLALCCVLLLVVSVVALGYTVYADPTPTVFVAELPTVRALPTASATPEPTNTRVIPPPPTLATPIVITPRAQPPTRTTTGSGRNVYNIVVPTPTAPSLVYPVTYDSLFTVVTYPVAGKTLKDLSRSLDANAVSDPHEPDSRYYARTDWYLSSNWVWKPTGRGCEVDRARVSIAITMTLPALATSTGVAPDALSRWNTFLDNTIVHEKGHVQISLQGARDYQRDLGNFPPAPDCNAIRPQLSDLFSQNFEAIDRASVEYDAKTRHGETQGAIFP